MPWNPRPSLLVTMFAVLLAGAAFPAAAAAVRRRAVVPPAVVSSEALIDQALAAGEIDANTALMYRVFADFGDPRLPDSYRGNAAPPLDSSSLAEAAAQWDSLPPDIQDAIAPFLIPPFQSGSWADTRAGKVAAASVRPQSNPLQFCGPVNTDEWDSVESSSGSIRVWWQKNKHPEDSTVAHDIVEDGDSALQQYESLLGRNDIPDDGELLPCRGGDDAIDIALADVRTSQTVPYTPATNAISSFVLLQRTAPDGPQATLAHELFHVMQFTYDVQGVFVLPSYKWLMEATAQWAMDYHQRLGNSGKEQRAAPIWFNAPDKSLTLVDPTQHEYGAYLFFLYLSRKYGDSIIRNIWDATADHDAASAVDSAIPGGFKERWPEFALDAWNHAPQDVFNQWDEITLTPAEEAGRMAAAPDLYANFDIDLPGLSARYIHAVIDPSVRSFAFLNGITFQMTTADYTVPPIDYGQQYTWADAADATRGASVHAILKRNGEWQPPEDWSGVHMKTFCQELPDEHVDELVLIITNSDTDGDRHLKPPALDPLLIATNIGCKWQGTATFTNGPATNTEVGQMTRVVTATADPDDPSTAPLNTLGYHYTPSAESSSSVGGQTSQGCSSTGGGNEPVTASFFTFNFAPQGSATYRKGIFSIVVTQPAMFTITCPDLDPLSNELTWGSWFPPDDVLQRLDIKPDGTVGGFLPASDGSGTWKYSFTQR
ncbi:MAG TPA: DUF6055 domain-containing protein [Thermoanaerobaculia bacterium]|nr:DUF6055 domain-containing protein [Thermoanaerobaculia bacterium]